MSHFRRYHRPTLVVDMESNWRADIEAAVVGNVGMALEKLLPLLDGDHSIEEIYGSLLVEDVDVELIFQILDQLDRHGVLEESSRSEFRMLSDAEVSRYRTQLQLLATLQQEVPMPVAGSAFQAEGIKLQAKLKNAQVLVIELGIVGSNFVHALALMGVGSIAATSVSHSEPSSAQVGAWVEVADVEDQVRQFNPFVSFQLISEVEDGVSRLFGLSPSLVVYCPDHFDESTAKQINLACLQHKIPVLFYRQRGLVVEMGPLVIPRQCACYDCYVIRRQAATAGLDVFEPVSGMNGARLNLPLSIDWLAMETVKFLMGVGEPITRGRLLRVDFMSGTFQLHPVLKLPRCLSCGTHKSHPLHKLWEERI